MSSVWKKENFEKCVGGGGKKKLTRDRHTHFYKWPAKLTRFSKRKKGKRERKKKGKNFLSNRSALRKTYFLSDDVKFKGWSRVFVRGDEGEFEVQRRFHFRFFFLLLISNLHTRTPHLPDVVAALARVFLSYLLICRNAPSENCFKGKNTILSAFFCHFFPRFPILCLPCCHLSVWSTFLTNFFLQILC